MDQRRPTAADPTPKPAPPPGTGEPSERRNHPRRAGNPIPVLILDSFHPDEPLHGWVMDRSPGGVGLLVEDALEVDTVVQMRPDVPHLRTFWLPVRVGYCQRERLRWRVGCQFVKKLSWEELRVFG